MKILIPMSGSGNRFVQAGYQDPKPLIKVHGRPIIEYVVRLFPGASDFVFVCREEHLAATPMERILKTLVPNCQIVSMPGEKLGPVSSAAKAFHLIADDKPIIVNYCDFFMDWDYADFCRTVTQNQCDGNVVSYRGFHPHLLHEKNFYASTRVDSENWMQEIREKHSFTPVKGDSPQSVGTYYFRQGALMKKYFNQLMEERVQLNGEYYVSLVYNLLARDGLKVHVYDKVRHFCQWGTPEDLQEYQYWESIFASASKGDEDFH